MKYCYECGEKLVEKECFNCGVSDGFFPYCENCGEFRFPFFNVAISSVIYNSDYSQILLIKQYGRDRNILVAGYVNKKETLEEALVREIKEEIGLEVENYTFNQSQYFEKSNTLICNFICSVKDQNFKLNPEVDSAQWYSVSEARKEVLQGGLAQYFLELSLEKVKANVCAG